jgi:putative hydrolase of the HAD superfamily
MTKAPSITCLFVDIGGVLLTNGWDHKARARAATTFKLDLAELEYRHHLNFDTFEQGKLTLGEYLDRVIFHQKRPFTKAQFRRFMFDQSKPYPEMLALLGQLKAHYGLKVAVVSNEGRELNEYRIRKFKLSRIADFFVCSALVHLRKPDRDIFQLALDIAQTPVEKIVYLENTSMFIEVAGSLGIRGILHTGYESTRTQLASLGLSTVNGIE